MAHPAPEFQVEIIYVPDCGHLEETKREVERALRDLNIPRERARIQETRISSIDEASEHGMTGSPMVRVNGTDIQPLENRPRMHCRHYMDADHEAQPYPPASLIRDALRQARQEKRHTPDMPIERGD